MGVADVHGRTLIIIQSETTAPIIETSPSRTTLDNTHTYTLLHLIAMIARNTMQQPQNEASNNLV